jgi:predicted unusual protein kinase regulating ubiquinone biosynthesis (AarF/ABC1/UbiB family)
MTLRVLHFDPHPGNIYILENNRIALLDYGMSGEITQKMSDALKESLRAFGRKDYARLLSIMKDLGFLKKDVDEKILKLGASMARGIGLVIAFLYFLFYRKRSRREAIRRMLEK